MAKDYTTIENSYNNNLERSGSIVGSIEVGSVVQGTPTPVQTENTITSGKNLENIWIKNWIKSTNYKPKTHGFYLDSKLGYIEANKMYIGSGGIVGGHLDIPDTTTANSFHVDSNGNTWWGANIATGYSGANAYVLNTGVALFKSITLSTNVILSGLQSGSSLDGQYIQNATITGSKIGNATITATNITSGTITATQIANLTITATQIANLTITGGKIATATIDNAKINSLSADKINAGTMNATRINGGDINGVTITGVTITGGIMRTSSSGKRVL